MLQVNLYSEVIKVTIVHNVLSGVVATLELGQRSEVLFTSSPLFPPYFFLSSP